MKKKKILTSVISVIAVLLLAAAAFIIVTGSKAASLIADTDEERSEQNSASFLSEQGFDTEAFNSKWKDSTENINFISKNENNVFIKYICAQPYEYEASTIVIIPSMGYDCTQVYPVADYFLDSGFNVITFDQRKNGRNTGDTFTFGRLESDDIAAVLDYMQSNLADMPPLCLYAQGTGTFAASYYLSSGENQFFELAVFEDPYSSASEYIDFTIAGKNGSIPEDFFRKMAVSNYNRKNDVNTETINMLSYAEKITVPSLVLYQDNCDNYSGDSGQKFFEALGSDQKEAAAFSESDFLEIFYDENEKFAYVFNYFLSGE